MNATFASVRPVHVSDTDALAALYIARLLQKQIVPIRVFNDSLYTEEIRALVGISPSEGNIPKAKALQLLKVQLPQLNTMTGKRTPRLQRNIHMLGRLLSLTDIEEAILTFFVLMDHHFVLAELLSNVVIMDKDALVRLMSVALSIEREIINAHVQSSSTLFATGLLAQELRSERIGVNIKIPRGIKDALLSEADSIESLMKVVLEPSPKPTLRALDFEHLGAETDLLHDHGKINHASQAFLRITFILDEQPLLAQVRPYMDALMIIDPPHGTLCARNHRIASQHDFGKIRFQRIKTKGVCLQVVDGDSRPFPPHDVGQLIGDGAEQALPVALGIQHIGDRQERAIIERHVRHGVFSPTRDRGYLER